MFMIILEVTAPSDRFLPDHFILILCMVEVALKESEGNDSQDKLFEFF